MVFDTSFFTLRGSELTFFGGDFAGFERYVEREGIPVFTDDFFAGGFSIGRDPDEFVELASVGAGAVEGEERASVAGRIEVSREGGSPVYWRFIRIFERLRYWFLEDFAEFGMVDDAEVAELFGEEFEVAAAGLSVVRTSRVEEFFAEGGVFFEGFFELPQVVLVRQVAFTFGREGFFEDVWVFFLDALDD